MGSAGLGPETMQRQRKDISLHHSLGASATAPIDIQICKTGHDSIMLPGRTYSVASPGWQHDPDTTVSW